MAKKGALSELQIQLLERLKKEERIQWVRCKPRETHSLTSLVKRGLVEKHNVDRNGDNCALTYWALK